MNKIYLFFLLVLSTIANAQTTNSPQLFNAAWVPAKAKGYIQLSQTAIYAQQYYTAGGNVENMTTAGLYSTEVDGNIGLGSRFAVSFQAPLFVRATRNSVLYQSSGRTEAGDQVNTIGDIAVGFKYALVNTSTFALSGSLMLGVPTGTTKGGDSQLLQTGDGEFNQVIQLDLSYAISSFYLTGGVGFNNRTNSFSDEIRARASIGWAYNRFLTMIQANMVHSLNNGTASETPQNVFSNNVRYVTITPKVAFRITKKLVFSASMGGIVSGRNMLKAPVYNTGVLLKF